LNEKGAIMPGHDLTETLDRTISICARRETVFRYFTDSARFARWWGEGSQIDARKGGAVLIRFPGGNPIVRGKVLEVDPPRRIEFTYLLEGAAQGGAKEPGDSLVTITLDETEQGTRLHLRHAFASAKLRDQHVQGWRHQLAVFSKVVNEEQHNGLTGRVDAFLRAFGNPDGQTRRSLMESCATPGVVFRDAFSATEGIEDMLANLDAVQIFMPGITLERAGDVRLSQGTAIVPWVAKKSDGEPAGRGTNVFDLAPDGRIARVVGFWEG
jgi:uncharacterized protein YndB with AHSA1/START domain